MVTAHICDFGCGKTAAYHFRNGKHCCGMHHRSCPAQQAACAKPQQLTSEELHARFIAQCSEDKELLEPITTRAAKVQVRCMVCQHIWRAAPASLLNGRGCPQCGKIIARDTPKHPKAGVRWTLWLQQKAFQAITPYQGVNSPIRVRCITCNYEWVSTPQRLRKHGCYPCGHRSKGMHLRRSHDQFIQKVNQTHDDKIRILGTYTTGKNRIDVSCAQCGHHWAPVAGRLICDRARGCPRCCSSKGEQHIARILRDNAIVFSQEHTFPNLKSLDGGRLRFDFAIWKNSDLVRLIEYDGAHHFYSVKHMGGDERFRKQQRNDNLKNAYCQARGIPLVRIHQQKLSCITLSTLQCQT